MDIRSFPMHFAVLILYPLRGKKTGEKPFIDLQCTRKSGFAASACICETDKWYFSICRKIFMKNWSFSIRAVETAAANGICESVSGEVPR